MVFPLSTRVEGYITLYRSSQAENRVGNRPNKKITRHLTREMTGRGLSAKAERDVPG